MKRLLAAAVLAAATAVAAAAAAVEIGDDGLYKTPWLRDTFKDLRDDLAEAGT